MPITTRSDQITADQISHILTFIDNNKINGNSVIPFIEEIVTILSSKSGQVFIKKSTSLSFRTVLINKFAVEFHQTHPKLSKKWYQQIFNRPLVVAEPESEPQKHGFDDEFIPCQTLISRSAEAVKENLVVDVGGGGSNEKPEEILADTSVQEEIAEDVKYDMQWWKEMRGEDGPVFVDYATKLIKVVTRFLEDLQNVTSKRIAIEIIKDIAQKLGSSDGQDVLQTYPKFKEYMETELYFEYDNNGLYELYEWWFIMFRCKIEHFNRHDYHD
jgi:hypothetical protein